MNIKETGKLIKVNKSHCDGVRIFTNLWPGDIYVSNNTAYSPQGMAELLVFEGPEPGLENCTIRELEMFKLGFKHGRKVAHEEIISKTKETQET